MDERFLKFSTAFKKSDFVYLIIAQSFLDKSVLKICKALPVLDLRRITRSVMVKERSAFPCFRTSWTYFCGHTLKCGTAGNF